MKPRSSLSPSLEQAFDQYYPAIFRYFRYRGADAESANDLAAAVFERALTRLHQYDPHKAQLQTWLFAIAHSISVNHWKSDKQSLPLDEDLPGSDDPPLEETVILTQDRQQILLALGALDERSHEIIALKFGAALGNREIAGLTGLTENNVGVILYRSLRKLRTLLAKDQADGEL